MGAFDYTTNGVTMPTHAWLPDGVWIREDMSLTHNTPEYLQTCHKINNSIVPYKKIFNRIHISW